jgi:hypothetical protein
MTAKFAGRCRCGAKVSKGSTIDYDRSLRAVTACPACRVDPDVMPRGIVGPCWTCNDPSGKFRSYGVSTPVYCDACETKARARDRARWQPDPVDLAYEDQCAREAGVD